MESTDSSSQDKNKKNFFDVYFEKMRMLKTSDAFILKIVLLSLAIFLVLFLIQKNYEQTVEVATNGGVFSEGVLGTPRFVNPVLAGTRADRDLTALVYDGLMKLGSNGELFPNIAESVTVSEDGLVYNVVIRKGVTFHDGNELTAQDVVFTTVLIQDPVLKSPLRANFDGVLVEEIGSHELNFILPEAYSPFVENLTFGILPYHIWKDASAEEFPFSQHNTEAIGSGPYAVEKIVRNASGLPEKYTLRSNASYHFGAPKIEIVELLFYPTESELITAFQEEDIESIVGLSGAQIETLKLDEEEFEIIHIPQPRTFAVFLNQNKSPAFRDSAVRTALDIVIDKNDLIETVLDGYGNPLYSPVPPGFGVDMATNTPEHSMDQARELLRDSGWKINPDTNIWEKEIDDIATPLSFSISTVNSGTFEATAEYLRSVWAELGAEVSVKQFELSDLKNAVIRPRDYQALLFGTQLGRSLDFYSFWHSSQKDDPGLNIALYANITTDSVLSELRRNTTLESKTETVQKFAEEINSETPAIFLYAPELTYVFPHKIKNETFSGMSEPHERYSSVHNWYIETESVWPIFTQ